MNTVPLSGKSRDASGLRGREGEGALQTHAAPSGRRARLRDAPPGRTLQQRRGAPGADLRRAGWKHPAPLTGAGPRCWPARRRRERLTRRPPPPHPASGHRGHPPAASSLPVSKFQKRGRPTLQMSSDVLGAQSRVQLSPGTNDPALCRCEPGLHHDAPGDSGPLPLEDAGRGARRGHCPWSEGPEECFCCS